MQLIDELPDFIPTEHWQAFLDMRKSIKKAPTEFAKRLLIKKLAQFKQAGEDLEKVLEQSIVNNWTDIYSAKKKGRGTVSVHVGFGNNDYNKGVGDDGSF